MHFDFFRLFHSRRLLGHSGRSSDLGGGQHDFFCLGNHRDGGLHWSRHLHLFHHRRVCNGGWYPDVQQHGNQTFL